MGKKKKIYFIYGLYEPDSDILRYVGKTTNPDARLANHFSNPPNQDMMLWFQDLRSIGKKPEIRIIETVRYQANKREQFWIRKASEDGCELLNYNHIKGNKDRYILIATKVHPVVFMELLRDAKKNDMRLTEYLRWKIKI